MKHKFLLLSALLVAFFAIGCDDDEDDFQPVDPVLTVNTKVLDIPNEGGHFTLGYEIENPVSGAEVSLTCGAEWVEQLVAREGVISFYAVPNEELEPRETKLIVSYRDAADSEVTIRQAEGVAPAFVKLAAESVAASLDGGVYSVEYTIDNPREGAVIAPQTTADWISKFNLDKEGVLEFEVAPNPGVEVRESVVEVTYPGMTDAVQFKVVQDAPNFQVEFTDITTIEAYAKITPADKDMPYIAFIHTAFELSILGDDDEGIFMRDMEFFKNQASHIEGLTPNEVINTFSLKGAFEGKCITQLAELLAPDTEYVLCLYGVDAASAQQLTPVDKYPFKTVAIPMRDTQFDMNVEVTKGTHVEYQIAPIDYSGYYYVGIVGGLLPEYTYEQIADAVTRAWMQNLTFAYGMGLPQEELMGYTFSVTGPQAIVRDMAPNQKWTLIAFSVNEGALINSKISYEFFETTDVEPSSNEITIELRNVTPHSIDYTFRPINDDVYAVAYASVSEVKDFATDEEIMDYLIKNRNLKVDAFRGEYSSTLLGLEADTDYFMYAFGCVAGKYPTTKLFKAQFRTSTEEYADLALSLDCYDYYDSEAVAALCPDLKRHADPSRAFIKVDVHVDPDAVAFFWSAMTAEEVDIATEQDLRQLLQQEGSMDEQGVILADYGVTYKLVAVAITGQGKRTHVWKSEPIAVTRDGVGNPQEMADWLNGEPKAAPAPYGVCSGILRHYIEPKSGDFRPVGSAPLVQKEPRPTVAEKFFIPGFRTTDTPEYFKMLYKKMSKN